MGIPKALERSSPSYDFIIGSGNSGTTLLTMMLNANPKVLAIPEVRFVMGFNHLLGKAISKDQFFKQYDKFIYARYTSHPKTRFNTIWKLNPGKIKVLISDLVRLPEACMAFAKCLQIGEKDNSSVSAIVDKNPDYTFHVDTLLKIFPEAKFVLCVRDYRAVTLSNLERPNNKWYHLPAFTAYLWCKHNKAGLRLKSKYPDKIHIVQYDKLVTEPRKVILDLCTFLNIEFFEEMLSHNEKIISTGEGDILNQKKWSSLNAPVNASRINAWRTKLTEKQIKQVEFICGSIGSAYGYKEIYKLSLVTKINLWIASLPMAIVGELVYRIYLKSYYMLPFSIRCFLMRKFNIKS